MRLNLPSKPAAFTILMLLCGLLSLLPARWTRWVGGILQPVTWLQSVLTAGARAVTGESDGPRSSSDENADHLRAEVEELRRQLGQESVAFAELEQRLADVTGIRDQLRENRTRILIARVISEDASPLRDSLLITRGSSEGVRVGQWVVAGKSAAATAGESGRELLGREWLIGRVSEVQPFRSRVLLATDANFPKAADQKLTRVRLARVLADGTWQMADGESLLIGTGRGRMRIEQAIRDYFAEGYRIVVAPASKDLPVAMTLGSVVASSPVVEAPLMFNLEVRPWGDAVRLGHIYLICPPE